MKIWAHRGCSYRFPENTISSFSKCLEYKIAGIELDIQLSKDGELVVIHDEKVDRTTDGTGYVKNMTLSELKELRIVANPESNIPYERIPTMREVFDLVVKPCKQQGLLINIELKNSIEPYEGMEQKILELVEEYGLEDRIVYSSFSPESVKLLKELKGSVVTGILSPSLKECLDISRRINVDALHPFVNRMDVENIREYTSLPVRAWNTWEEDPFFPDTREIQLKDTDGLERIGITDIFTNAAEEYVPKIKDGEMYE